MRQWMLRITAYADRLIKDLDLLDWPESLKEMQRNWIGRSVGAEVDFEIVAAADRTAATTRRAARTKMTTSDLSITVFTTRPDTLYGATYMVLAPEHPLVDRITPPERREIDRSVSHAWSPARASAIAWRTRRKRPASSPAAYAINPVNDEKIPIYIADYVLMGYGTGAIMAVPAHDERDFEFAKKVRPADQAGRETGQRRMRQADRAFTGEGIAINSAHHRRPADRRGEGARSSTCWQREGVRAQIDQLQAARLALLAASAIGASRFRSCWMRTATPYALDESELPLTLPEMDDFKPTGTPEPPLSKAKDWMTVTRDGKTFTRETNTMPQWAGSCWYYLRYIDPKNTERFVDPAKEKYWMPVDLYVGGVEHAVLHLLYSRFWHKVLFDLGHVSTPEPFMRLVNQGLILGEMEFHVF